MQCGWKCPHLDNVDATPRLLSPTTSPSPRVTNRLAQSLPSDLSARPSLPLGLPSGHLWWCICRIPLVAHFPQRPKPFSSAYALASCFPEISNKRIIAALSYAATTSSGLMRQIRFSCEVPINNLVLQMMTPELREAFNFFPVTMPVLGPRTAHLQYELPVLLSSLKICLYLHLRSWRKKSSCSPVFFLHLDLGFLWSPTALPSISYFFPLSCSPASPPSLPPSPTNAFGPPCFTNTLLIWHFCFAINLPKGRLSQVGHLLLPHTLLASPLTYSMSKALLPSLTVCPGVPSAPSWTAPCPPPTLLFLSALNSKGDGDDFTFRTEQKPDKQFPGAREMAKAGLPGKFLWAGVLFSRMTTHNCHF